MKTAKKAAAKKSKTPAKKSAPRKAATATKRAMPKKAAAKKAAPKKAAAKKSASRMQPMDDHSMLREFFIDSLKDIYWAEKHLTKALPKMQKAATSEELKTAFEEHLAQTEEQIQRLEQVFEIMDEPAKAKKCDAMEGLTKEAQSIIEETAKGTATRDVALIMAAQKVEHYEIATYGGLAQLAGTLGLEDAKELLGMTLQEEKDTDENLTAIAENDINIQAAEEDEEEDSDDEEEEDDDEMEDDEEEEEEDDEM